MRPFNRFLLFALLSCLLCIFPSPAYASTDPQLATASATATVPTLSVTGDHTAPTNPILIRPTDGSRTSDNRPEFVWKSSSDTGSNTIIYTLYLNGIATYLGVSNLGNSSGTGYTASLDGSEIKLKVNISILDGTYNWYVTATDPSGNTSYSTTWNLIIDTTAPELSLIDLDVYHNPVIIEGSNFDVDGPKDVYFTVLSDPLTTIQITLESQTGDIYRIESKTNSNGLAYLYQHLDLGVYYTTIVAIDPTGNTSVLPGFNITVTQAQIEITIPPIPPNPGATPIPIITIPYTPFNIPSLPATIAKIETRVSLPYLISTLLAVAILILLILIWWRRYNFILIDPSGKPIKNAVIYHSIPTTRSEYSQILVTKRDPISYQISHGDHGRLYIPHLDRYSTFTVRLENITYIFSLSTKQQVYTIVLG